MEAAVGSAEGGVLVLVAVLVVHRLRFAPLLLALGMRGASSLCSSSSSSCPPLLASLSSPLFSFHRRGPTVAVVSDRRDVDGIVLAGQQAQAALLLQPRAPQSSAATSA
jgi:hypothetical protein